MAFAIESVALGAYTPQAMAKEERLQKIIARAGIASRRKAEELIQQGQVRVNGEVVKKLGVCADASKDQIEVGGVPISVAETRPTRIYILLNKPRGVMCTRSDPEGRKIIYDLLDPEMPRVYSAGRLDYHSEGALILTNDGVLTNALTHPRHDVVKQYEVKVRGQLSSEESSRLEKGVVLDGRRTRPTPIIEDRGSGTGKNTWYQIALTEGRNRQIRRMMESVGHPVMRLRRTAIGPIELGDLPIGKWRSLSPREVEALRTTVGLAGGTPARKRRKR